MEQDICEMDKFIFNVGMRKARKTFIVIRSRLGVGGSIVIQQGRIFLFGEGFESPMWPYT